MWDIPPTGPIIAPGALHPFHAATRAGAAHVVPIDDLYHLVYWGTDPNGQHHILHATSAPDAPNDWTPTKDPLLSAQPENPYNSRGPSFPFLLPVSADYWLLYYCGWGDPRPDGKLPNTTGVALSSDSGQTWRYHDGQLPRDHPCDREGTGSVWVLYEDGRFRLYYTAIGHYFPRPDGAQTGHGDTIPQIGIAYAESDDGLHWAKPRTDWIVKPRGFTVEPYEYICSKPCIVKDGATYTMWVNTFGTAYRVHRLHSLDGLHWQWTARLGPDGELGTGPQSAFDDQQRCYPTIVHHQDHYRCWYTGNGFGTTGIGYATQPATS